MMSARPGFTAVAILSIALGIGATTTIFSVVYAVLIDPYPYRSADRIGWIGGQSGASDQWQPLFSQAQYLEVRSRVHSMEDEVAVQQRQPILTGGGLLPQVVKLERASTNLFDFLGVPALLGREFSSKDFVSNGEPERVAVISNNFWRRTFHSTPDVLGKRIVMDHAEYTIIGVLPVRFRWNDADVYAPIGIRAGNQDFVQIYSRVRPNVSSQQVQAEFDPLIREFQKQVPRWFYRPGPFRVKWVGVNDGILGKFATTLLVLFGSVVLLLLIGCGNVANLLLARATTREGEMGIRTSIGATRGRLICQMLTESVLLALVGGGFGVLLAVAGLRVVVALLPEYSVPHEAVIALNWPVLWFATAVTVLTGIFFGLLPAMQISGKTQIGALKSISRSGSTGLKHRRLLDGLIVFEIALSLVLLTGAGLALKGLLTLERKPLGYEPGHVLTFEVPLGEGNYIQYGARRNFFEAVASSVRAIPGVNSVAISEEGTPPWNGLQTQMMVDNRPRTEPILGLLNIVGDGYFSTVRQPLLRGRSLSHDDILRASPVAVVSQDFAVRYYGKTNPIGHHIRVELFDQPLPAVILKAPNLTNTFEIVGVVATARNRGLDESPQPAVFVPYSVICSPGIWMLARTESDPAALVDEVRKVVRNLDSQQAITEVHPLAYWLQFATSNSRFGTFLFGAFGGVGLMLAGAGVFGVVSYGVAQRTREFGIRMALGASAKDLLQLVLTGVGRVFVIGLTLGLAFSSLATHKLSDRMQGMGTADISLFLVVAAVLLVMMLAASLIPAYSVTSVQPMEAMRHE
jgi:predicted permease